MKQESSISVLIATGLYPPEIGGPATYTRMLEEKLPAHGFVLDVLPFGTVRHLPKVVRHIAFGFELYKRAKHCDILYALDPVSVGLPALLVSKLRRKPFMVRLGGDYAWEQGQQRFGLEADLDTYTHETISVPLRVRLLAAVQSFVVRRAKRVIVPSNYMKGIVHTWGATEEQLRTIYSALFPLSVEEAREAIRQQLNYQGPVIVSVGRLVPWKGFEALIDAVADLNDQGIAATLVIAGDGPLEDALQLKVKTMGLEGQVRLVGRLGKDALGAVIKGADVFALNTAYEGLSHQLLEVMDLGVPIVTTPVGGNAEIIQDGVQGLLVPCNDTQALAQSIRRFLDSPELRTRLIQNAKVRTKAFAQERVVEEIATIMRNEVL